MKMQADFGGGNDTILYAVESNHLYSYRQEFVAMHEIYGGNKFYSSITGLSGAGFFTDPYDLLIMNTYRTDVKDISSHISTGHHELDGVQYYIPYIKEEGVDCRYPIVAVKGNNIAMFPIDIGMRRIHRIFKDELSNLISGEHSEFCKKEFRYFNMNDEDEEKQFTWFLMTNGEKGVDCLSFLDLSDIHYSKNMEADDETANFLMETLNLRRDVENGKYCHINKHGYIDRIFDDSFEEISTWVSDLVEGFVGLGYGVFWKRRKNDVYSFAFREREKSLDNLPKYVEYEESFSIHEFFWNENIRGYMIEKVEEKEEKEYINAFAFSLSLVKKVEELLNKNRTEVITIKDSLEAGNCEHGTMEWLGKHFNNENIKSLLVSSIIEIKELNAFEYEKIIGDPAFRKVILNKFSQE